ncbi:prolyl oligopeptidase [Trichoderma cornu-damae]|uniref:Dipeptidyl-peptidase V n=1 Tax=Trichoderma cornu-damae TaxID=654480 RepID=A0A9P8QR65_9HYPO|nr:prolyl oligopeptidase [Trichoderma cornu-damae]
MVRVQELTAEALLSEPRRGPAVPNRDGTHALYTVSTHILGDKMTHEIRVLDIQTGSSKLLSNDARVHDAAWIPAAGLDVIYLVSADKGRTRVMIASAGDGDGDEEEEEQQQQQQQHYVAAEIDAPVSNLKLKALSSGGVAFVVTGLWNASYRPNRFSLWYNELVLHNSRWTLQGPVHNLIGDVDLEAPSRMYSDDPCNDFDVCGDGIAFSSRNLSERGPDGSPAASIYFARLDSFSQPPGAMPRQICIPSGFEPALITNVRFTPDASSIGFLYAAHEDPYDTRLYLASVNSLDAFDVFGLVTCADDEDQNPPNAFEFAGSGDSVILRSHQLGHQALSHLVLQDGATPRVFFTGGSCSAFYPLRQGDWRVLLTTSSSFIDSSLWQIVQVAEASAVRKLSSASKNGAKFGLCSDMVTEFWYEGASGCFIHCWMLRPRDFDESKQYPWVLAPHGRPAMAWNNEWSTTACPTNNNFASWAARGYVVVLPNLTGSSGYGLEFVRRIRSQRGDRPFQDILSLMDHLEAVPYLDKAKATVVGSSSAAYLVNRLLGHDVAKKKEPLFDTFDRLDHVAYPYPDPERMMYENDMARSTFFHGWKNAPPTLIVHGEKDKQCSITEALTAFNSLQAQGVPSRLLTFPDEGHVAAKPENVVMWYEVVWEWASKCVDGDVAVKCASLAGGGPT